MREGVAQSAGAGAGESGLPRTIQFGHHSRARRGLGADPDTTHEAKP